jgi:hypothetical protein
MKSRVTRVPRARPTLEPEIKPQVIQTQTSRVTRKPRVIQPTQSIAEIVINKYIKNNISRNPTSLADDPEYDDNTTRVEGYLKDRYYIFSGGGSKSEYSRTWLLLPDDEVVVKHWVGNDLITEKMKVKDIKPGQLEESRFYTPDGKYNLVYILLTKEQFELLQLTGHVMSENDDTNAEIRKGGKVYAILDDPSEELLNQFK